MNVCNDAAWRQASDLLGQRIDERLSEVGSGRCDVRLADKKRNAKDDDSPTKSVTASPNGAARRVRVVFGPILRVCSVEMDDELMRYFARSLDAPTGVTESDSVPEGGGATVERGVGSGAVAEEAGHPTTDTSRPLKISAARISKRFSIALARERPHLELYSATLTKRGSAKRGELKRLGREFAQKVCAAYPGAQVILAVDRGKNGRWHLHGPIMLARPRSWSSLSEALRKAHLKKCETNIRRLWLRLWPKKKSGERPHIGAQTIRHVATQPGTVRVLTSVLKHALDRHAEREAREDGDLQFRMPNLLSRVIVGGVWAHGALGRAIHRKRKPSKPHSRRRKSGVPGERCFFCGEKFLDLVHRDRRFHDFGPSCGRRAERALKTVIRRTQSEIDEWLSVLAEREMLMFKPMRADFDLDSFVEHNTDDGWHVRVWLDALEATGWLRLDALRVIEKAIEVHAWPTLHPLSNRALADVLDCPVCLEMKAGRLNAVTCGSARCRVTMRRERQKARSHDEARPRPASIINPHSR